MKTIIISLLLVASQSLLTAALSSEFNSAWASSEWVNAGATFFGRDPWSLNDGSCGYGFVCPNRWKDELASGYDLVSISDHSPLYSGSTDGAQCGRCLEVQCRDGNVEDDIGGRFERTSVCKNHDSVKLKVTDLCACVYPDNAASNARWCCGHYPHLDISQWALDKIALDTEKWGVFAVKYRPIDCDQQLSNPAPAIPLVKSPHDNMKPANLQCSTQSYGSPGSSGGGPIAATTDASSSTDSSSPASTPKPSKPSKPSKKHSAKYLARRQVYLKARDLSDNQRPEGLYWKIVDYFSQFNTEMRRIKSKGRKNPL